MTAALGRLLCRLGDRLLGVGDRLQTRKLAEIQPLGEKRKAAETAQPLDRPLVNFDQDSLSAAFALLAAVERSDLDGYHVLTKHSDSIGLLLSLVFTITDALAAPSSTDVAAYADDLFERLARRRE
jgi:hypothetical protein